MATIFYLSYFQFIHCMFFSWIMLHSLYKIKYTQHNLFTLITLFIVYPSRFTQSILSLYPIHTLALPNPYSRFTVNTLTLPSPYSRFTQSILSLYPIHTLALPILSLYPIHTLTLPNPYSRFTQSVLSLYRVHTLALPNPYWTGTGRSSSSRRTRLFT